MWTDESRKHIIDLKALLDGHQPGADIMPEPAKTESIAGAQAPLAEPPGPSRRHLRVTRTLMFADLVGYSRLEENQVPFFMHEFLEAVAARLKGLPEQPRFVNTWGDAIFAVMDRAIPIARYALALRDVVRDTEWKELGFADMKIRIGLHTGPIYEGQDALTGRTNYYGSHVNRAARLEPVTVPGHIYASEQFVGLLLSEQADPACRADDIRSEYVGTLALAKRFGHQPVYHIRGRSPLRRAVAPQPPTP
jgi:class 3 adenylate cyclase